MWTHRDAGTNLDKSKYVATISSALPTLAHMAISELCRRGIVKSVVSTNVDGLHMRSGVPSSQLSELHGNSYLEVCEKCGERYLRDADILQNQTPEHRLVNRHWCGGKCEKEGCDGLLLDTIIAFGEMLPTDQLEQATKHSQEGDLALVLGTTMMVQPACLLPEYVYKKKNGSMVICNLQTTQFDKHSSLRLHGRTDDVMHLVMQELGIEIPTETPSGLKIPTYFDDIDEYYTKRQEENKRKLEEIKKEKAENPHGTSNALTRGENIYHRATLSGKNETRDVHFDTLQLVFFTDCHSGTYNVTGKSKKIVVEDCHDTTITITGKVITNTLELINSSNLTIIAKVPILTLTCDNVKGVTITFEEKDFMQMIAWAQTTENKLFIGSEAVAITTSEEPDLQKDQIVTQKLESGEIVSRLTRRDRCGRITGLV
jgi:NAD-dependent SIR2 family protein deacetylase